MRYVKLWIAFGLVILLSFCVLIFYGLEIYREAPPVPKAIVTAQGDVLATESEIKDGQNVWQSIGGQELGSIWGHGAYLAPDWTADLLHRESIYLLNLWATEQYGKPFSEIDDSQRAVLLTKLKTELRKNTYNPETGEITISADRAKTYHALAGYYAALFGDAEEFPSDVRFLADDNRTPPELRDAYAIPANTIKSDERQKMMYAFFFWATWACTTERPQLVNEEVGGISQDGYLPTQPITYTNNWPAEPLIGNRPTGEIIVWSVLSFVLLLAGIGTLSWYYAVLKHRKDDEHVPPKHDPLLAMNPTPSMKATLKYFWIVVVLLLVQMLMGAVTAHYGVEGEGFYNIPLAKWLPYSVTRTWHTQLGIFWIATAWLATGLFIAPAVSGHEPKFQRLGVNFLFVCLVIIVAGTLFGTWYATRQQMSLEMNFWFGHQGYEYVDLGRFWQLFLLVGLFLWLLLMIRAIWPAFKQPGQQKQLLGMFLIASAAIAIFYGAGIMWDRQTNLAVAEYWRWWVVHLWVEGFFEVFATVVIAFLFTRMGLLRTATASAAVIFSCTIFLTGGIIGTFHHLYFTGTPTAVLALGALFSALEIVPLVLIGAEAYESLTLSRAAPWVKQYKWPIYFFIAVAFWNLVGAGLFGFLINPPIALYYMQGLNTTSVHGHTALFGVYGLLGMGLTLFCVKGLGTRKIWRTGALSFGFWTINGGLALMVLISLLPVGLMQTWASVTHGLWYARSAEFLQSDLMDTLRWLRIVGDTIFAIGILSFAWFIFGLKFGWSTRGDREDVIA
ncbi:nitric-oxide reductase large subunit [Poriferisphaera sp. WC338]|uniref:nitric-oxide reductase large subunit n=1 Tax=Poriferisphaera sp. WC338 TaxID=3425129 RepID=UPI003D815252